MLIRLKAIKRAGKKNLFIIPYLFTYLNAIFGFLSILKSLEGEYKAAAIYILLAAFMDGIDGKLARVLNSVSCFGMELDSLCDAISFCLAPTILLYSWLPGTIGFFSKSFLAFYLCAGLFRLAKFNLSSEKQMGSFIGLPTTIAATFIASLILYGPVVSKHILLPVVIFLGCLMVSQIPFFSLKRYKFKFPKDYLKLLFLFSAFGLMVGYGYPVLLLLTAGYILLSICFAFARLVCKKLYEVS